MVGHADSARVVSRSEAVELRREFGARGERVVFTNGCFDLLHAGHVALLGAARAEGDRLIVAVNDDASVRRLKGEPRPLTPLADRLLVLAALRSVDVVFAFSEDTPYESIRLLEPDVLVKGADYALDEIVGADLVAAGGGRVVRIPLTEGRSTSGLIRRLDDPGGGRS